MDEKLFIKVKFSLESKGIHIIQDADGDSFLKAMGAEAITLSDGKAIIFQSGRVPSASAFYEEIIHAFQIKKNGAINTAGQNSAGCAEYLRREIEANEKLLKNAKAYKLTDNDIASVKENLEYYKRRRN